MSDLSTFSSAAKGLTKNPLGIIALFIVLVYGFASLTLGVTSNLESAERLPLVWFLVVFPFAVLLLFGWLVSGYHEHLYAPGDYRSDESFHKKRELSERRVAEVKAEQEVLKARIRETILDRSAANDITPRRWQQIADQVIADFDRSTNITVDARGFLDDDSAIFTFPIAAFPTVSDLANEVYFKLSLAVAPYEYGHTWVLRDQQTNLIIRTQSMLTDAPRGKGVPDLRSLSEVGVLPGVTLCVDRPN